MDERSSSPSARLKPDLAHVVHALKRRVHVRAPLLAGHAGACLRVAEALARDPANARVSARERTGSIVVESGGGALDADAVAARVAELVADERDEGGRLLGGERRGSSPGPTRLAVALVHAVAGINRDVDEALDHHADLATLLPVGFAVTGLIDAVVKRELPTPTWFNLLWWSVRSFMTFNLSALDNEVHTRGAPRVEEDAGGGREEGS